MNLNRLVSIVLGLLVLLGVGAAVYWSSERKSVSDEEAARLSARVALRVVSGSEKIPFLEDPRFLALMEKKGLLIESRKSGSREIATRADLKSFDIAFPAGQPAAAKIISGTKTLGAETIFVTPMVIASWQPIAEILRSNGIVRESSGTWWVIDMEKLLRLMREEKRWRDLPGNTTFAVGKSILVSTTNVATSNSAAQFLALTTYLANGRNVVTDAASAKRLALETAPLFSKQGFQEQSSAGPFEDYLSIGMGKVPLVWIYESQYFEQVLRGALKSDMVLLYPQPTIFSKHVAIAFSENGMRFLQAMKDPEAMAIAADYGFRVEGNDSLANKLAAKKIPVPQILDVADAPVHDVLESMIVTLETR